MSEIRLLRKKKYFSFRRKKLVEKKQDGDEDQEVSLPMNVIKGDRVVESLLDISSFTENADVDYCDAELQLLKSIGISNSVLKSPKTRKMVKKAVRLSISAIEMNRVSKRRLFLSPSSESLVKRGADNAGDDNSSEFEGMMSEASEPLDFSLSDIEGNDSVSISASSYPPTPYAFIPREKIEVSQDDMSKEKILGYRRTKNTKDKRPIPRTLLSNGRRLGSKNLDPEQLKVYGNGNSYDKKMALEQSSFDIGMGVLALKGEDWIEANIFNIQETPYGKLITVIDAENDTTVLTTKEIRAPYEKIEKIRNFSTKISELTMKETQELSKMLASALEEYINLPFTLEDDETLSLSLSDQYNLSGDHHSRSEEEMTYESVFN